MSRGQYGKPGIYNASPITLVDQEGSAVSVDSTGATIVTPAAGASFGASSADGSTFTQNSTTGGIAMGVYQASPDTLTTGKAGAIGVDINRNTKVVGSVASATADSGAPVKVGGKYNATPPTLTDGNRGDLQLDVNGNVKVTNATLQAGEDLTNNVTKVEQRFSYSAVAVADVQVKGSAGFLHTVTISNNDAAPTAGTLIIYDNTAESGTQVFNHTFSITQVVPFTVILDYTMATGIYFGFTTTGDVNVSCSFR